MDDNAVSTTVQITVEAPSSAVRLIRVAGRLDRAAAASVLRLVDVQLELVATRHRAITDLVIDIGAVSSFEPVGLRSLRHAVYSTGRRGIGLCLTGCGGRVHLLPVRVQQLLARFRTFPTADVAMRALAATRSSPASPHSRSPRDVAVSSAAAAGWSSSGSATRHSTDVDSGPSVPAPRPAAEQQVPDRAEPTPRSRRPIAAW